MKRGSPNYRRVALALVIGAVVLFGWTWLRAAGWIGDGANCVPDRTVERDADGTVVSIETRTCPEER